MRQHRTFDSETEAQEFAEGLSGDRITEVIVYEQKTLFAMGEVFQEGCWGVSWIEYSL